MKSLAWIRSRTGPLFVLWLVTLPVGWYSISRSFADDKPGQSSRKPLPGLIASPRELAGGLRWQMVTLWPRGTVSCFDVSPDGTRVAYADDAIVRIGTTKTFALTGILAGHEGRVLAVAWSPDGTRLATASADQTARLWTADGAPLAVLRGHAQAVAAVAWSRDGKELATSSRDGTIRLWQPDGKTAGILKGESPIVCVAFSPDGTRLVAGDEDRRVRIWKTDGTVVAVCEGHLGSIQSVDWSPDGKLIASGDAGLAADDQSRELVVTVRLWDPSGQQVRSLPLQNGGVTCVRFSPDSSMIATVFNESGEGRTSMQNNSKARIWTIDGTLVQESAGETDGFLRWRSDSKSVWLCGRDKIREKPVQDTSLLSSQPAEPSTSQQPLEKTFFERRIRFVKAAWSPVADHFAALTRETRLCIFDGNGRLMSAAVADARPRSQIDFTWNSDGKRILLCNYQALSSIFDLHGKRVGAIKFRSAGGSVDWSRQGGRIASARNKTILLAHSDGMVGPELTGHTGNVRQVAWSPDGTRLASASADSTLRFWRPDGTMVKSIKGQAGEIHCLAWRPDGQWIAAGMDDGSWRAWKPDGTEGPVYEGHAGPVTGIAYSPSGKHVATGGWDSTVRIWSSEGAPLSVLSGHIGPVQSVSWSADGKRLLSASRDSTLRIWNPDTGQPELLVLMLSDYTTATFSANGDLIDGRLPSVENDVRFVVERPDGRTDLLSPSEFRTRFPRLLQAPSNSAPTKRSDS